MTSIEGAARTRLVVFGAIAAMLFVVGAVFSIVGRHAPASESPGKPERARPRVAKSVGTPGPAAQRAGMAVGFSHDRLGARAAAITYATASQRWLYFTDDDIRTAVSEISTPAAASGFARDVVKEVSVARRQLGASPGRVWWLVRPLAWEVAHQDAAEARVLVWVITILSAEEVAAPQSEYMTVTVDLAWAGGDWRVDGIRDAPGPTPITGPKDQPWDARPFDDALAHFTRMDGEPVR